MCSEPSDMTEVSVIHTVGTGETAQPVEVTETDMRLEQPDTAAVAMSESTEKSAEPVILLFVLFVCFVCYVFVCVNRMVALVLLCTHGLFNIHLYC